MIDTWDTDVLADFRQTYSLPVDPSAPWWETRGLILALLSSPTPTRLRRWVENRQETQ